MTIPNSNRRVLVVGSWAKEEITIENLKQKPGLQAFAYIDTPNPGIMERADGYRLGDLYDVDAIVGYAREIDAELTLVTTAAPLAAGLADRMIKEGMKVFGPTREAARLESDKAFTRGLVQKYAPKAVPSFKVCKNVREAVDCAAHFDWQVAVKPVGLTDGLGVKVAGIQLKGKDDIVKYIEEIHQQEISGDSRVIVEEKMTGEEFTIQCFVHKTDVIPTPAVQDFKKLLNGEKGPNTASMGSYSDTGLLLPFMNSDDYRQALAIISTTLDAFHRETGHWCSGFLYGQFMLCKDGVKLVEYNFRPGDPEWMNTVTSLDDNIYDIVTGLMAGTPPRTKFKKKATVCKYIVPPDYPYRLNQVLEASPDSEKIAQSGAMLYWSCGRDENGNLNVGTERGAALLARGPDIYAANDKIQQAVAGINGTFYYRSDIGTRELIHEKINAVNGLKKTGITFRAAREAEFLEVHDFISLCPPLESYAPHVFKILLRHFASTCCVAEMRGRIVGFVLGFVSQEHNPETYFLWQIGTSPFLQGTGLGVRLLAEAEKLAQKAGCERMELTIDPKNIPSQKLFEKSGYQNISPKEGETVEVMNNLAVKDYYSPGRHFMLYEKAFLN